MAPTAGSPAERDLDMTLGRYEADVATVPSRDGLGTAGYGRLGGDVPCYGYD